MPNLHDVRLLQGPPFLNGELHVGHGVNIVLKDFWLRYSALLEGGKKENSNFSYNFDAQGLPIENQVKKVVGTTDKALLLNSCLNFGKENLEKMTPCMNDLDLFHPATKKNILCTSQLQYKLALMRYVEELYEKGIVVMDYMHINFCYSCGNTLANAEIEQKRGNSRLYVMEATIKTGPNKQCKILYCTTEPETCYRSSAIVISKFTPYYLYEWTQGENVSKLITANKSLDLILKGSVFLGEVPLSQLEDQKIVIYNREGEILSESKIMVDESSFVKISSPASESLLTDFAAVCINPYNSKKDYEFLRSRGEITNEFSNKVIIHRVHDQRTSNRALKERYSHYFNVLYTKNEEKLNEVCWRCKSLVGVSFLEQLYIKMPKEMRKEMVEKCKDVLMNNEGLKQKTITFFSNDWPWPISRKRMFGTPVPLMVCSNLTCRGKPEVVNYILDDFKSPQECYYPLLDEVIKRKSLSDSRYHCPICSNLKSPLNYSLDVWMDSGFLAIYNHSISDLLIEGVDQTRGWFHSLAILFYLKHGVLPYKKLMYLGWISTKNQKISKSVTKNEEFLLRKALSIHGREIFRSFALAKGGSANPVNYSKQIVQQEKKYVNVVKNMRCYLQKSDFEQFSSPDLRMQILQENVPETLSMISEMDALLQGLHQNVGLLKFNRYWLDLRNFILLIYSRKWVRGAQGCKDKNLLKTLKYIGQVLLEYVKPVLGSSF